MAGRLALHSPTATLRADRASVDALAAPFVRFWQPGFVVSGAV
jgi:hypothetical protein